MIIKEKFTITLDQSDDADLIVYPIPFTMNGLLKQIHFTVPDLDNSDTAELILKDSDGNEIYASGEKAESTTHVINVERALRGTITLRIETSGDQAADREFKVVLYYVE